MMLRSTELKAEMKNVLTVTSKMDNQLSMLNDIKAQLAAQAGAQAGWNNKLENLQETITASAGRDVNMLPKTAVDLLEYNLWAMVAIITTLCGLASTAITLSFRASRKREAERTAIEREERKDTANLLYKVLSMIPEQHRASVSKDIDALKRV